MGEIFYLLCTKHFLSLLVNNKELFIFAIKKRTQKFLLKKDCSATTAQPS
jgi:hypothetical protein